MISWKVLVLPLLLLCGLRSARAGALDVLPQELIVPQCSTLTALWSQTHLHVQPDAFINITNLVDLGVQNGTFTTFVVALPLGQNFSFAYNTLADQFTVFQSAELQVGAGTTNCLPTHPGNITPNPGSSAPSASSTGTASTESTSPSLTASNSVSSPVQSTPAAIVPESAAASGASKQVFPVGAIVGIVGAIVALFLIGFALFWRSHRRSMKLLADLRSDRERSAPKGVSAPAISQIIDRRRSAAIIPFEERAPSGPISPSKSMLVRSAQSQSSSGETTTIPVSSQSVSTGVTKAHRGPRDLVLNSPVTPTTAALSPRIHADGGVRIRDPEELPPVYHDYNTDR
ncbi:hypothetical protein B0H11DRAFT_1913449 [Mycena galericulata]|nr:hypothetical protein B0H11DRAFT_1913449 [Mycena galericulata]